MGYCARSAFLGFVLVTAVDLVLNWWDATSWPGWLTFLAVVAISVAVIPVQAATEEYVCRDWLVQNFASWARTPWPGAVASSLLFVVLPAVPRC
ncbi:CPBP family glutamic-type intramembrane protease [Saccharopolyspora hattusasensis]|uniref:CPBP family glutamic-type intramembrane protease n=1 Tax=Saccharopolyspora hattusasensis TaxID=1128679 RepID=UPI003D970C03